MTYDTLNDLSFHQKCKGYTLNSIYNCEICEFKACTSGGVRFHRLKIHINKNKTTKIDGAGEVPPTNANLENGDRQQGIISTHSDRQSNNSLFICDDCGFKSNSQEMIKHTKTCQNGNFNAIFRKVPSSSEKTNKNGELAGASLSNGDRQQIDNNTHRCAKCGFKSNRQEMMLHTRSCLNESDTKFDNGKKSLQIIELAADDNHDEKKLNKKHPNHRNDARIEVCPKCEFISNSEGMKLHSQSCNVTDPDLLNNCKKCDYVTKNSNNFKNHVENSRLLENIRYACKRCTFKYYTLMALRLHQKSDHLMDEIPEKKTTTKEIFYKCGKFSSTNSKSWKYR